MPSRHRGFLRRLLLPSPPACECHDGCWRYIPGSSRPTPGSPPSASAWLRHYRSKQDRGRLLFDEGWETLREAFQLLLPVWLRLCSLSVKSCRYQFIDVSQEGLKCNEFRCLHGESIQQHRPGVGLTNAPRLQIEQCFIIQLTCRTAMRTLYIVRPDLKLWLCIDR